MLRNALLAFATGVALASAWLRWSGRLAATPWLVWGLVCVLALLLERWRYAPRRDAGHWQETGECFVDPATGRPVRVLYDPRTGQRKYVE